jgi:hypothetical protein
MGHTRLLSHISIEKTHLRYNDKYVSQLISNEGNFMSMVCREPSKFQAMRVLAKLHLLSNKSNIPH